MSQHNFFLFLQPMMVLLSQMLTILWKWKDYCLKNVIDYFSAGGTPVMVSLLFPVPHIIGNDGALVPDVKNIV